MATTCYLHKQGIGSPNSYASLNKYLSTYTDCVTKAWNHMNHCVPLLEQECKAAQIRVIKTIRLSLDFIDKVVERNPDIKVIHLVRDPRAMLNSRRKWVFPTKQEILATCARMSHDITYSKKLLAEKPYNYYVIRYEDLVTQPMASARTIYRHVQLTPPDYFAEWLLNHTSAKIDNSPAGTIRSNSAAHVAMWKSTKMIVTTFSRVESDSCHFVLRELSY